MIYELTKKWIDSKVTVLNTALTGAALDTLKEVDTTLSERLLPSSLKDRTFMIKFLNVPNVIGSQFTIDIKLQMFFLIAKQQLAKYKQAIDKYIFALAKELANPLTSEFTYRDNSISTSLSISDIDSIKLSKLDETEGEYFTPSIEFTLKFNQI